jgi:pyrroloquinoline-quinone synthase
MHHLIDQILEEVDYSKNPYFQSLANHLFDKEDFIETQIQFFFAVVFFSRPMSALAAKIPTAGLRLEVLRNVWEEHGEGVLTMTHENTFKIFLERLGQIKTENIQMRVLWPEIRLFNTCLIGTCVIDDYMVGTAMMGIIERMFSHISGILGSSMVSNGWFTSENLIHYGLHEKLDVKHSQDFFDVLASAWDKSPEHRYHIEQGLRLGATVFNGMFLGLYQNRQRRLMREDYLGPHSRAEGLL